MTDVEIDAVAGAVLRRLLALLTVPSMWSTRRGHAPAGYSRREWQRIARQIGTRRGRWFVVTPEQLAAYEGRSAPAAATPPAPSPPPWTPAAALADVGARPTRRLRAVRGDR